MPERIISYLFNSCDGIFTCKSIFSFCLYAMRMNILTSYLGPVSLSATSFVGQHIGQRVGAFSRFSGRVQARQLHRNRLSYPVVPLESTCT